MSPLTDRTIDALGAEHRTLAALVPTLSDEQLAATSGASEWPVAQALSHLGSGAEIGLARLQATLTGTSLADDVNQGVWDRWNAMAPREQAISFLDHDAALVAALEALDDQTRETLVLEPGFMPFPLPVGSLAGMRLNEAALHGWDVRVALDADATLAPDSARVLVEQFAGGLSFLIGFVGKPDTVPQAVVLDVAGSGYALVIDDAVAFTKSEAQPSATFAGSLDSVVRLVAGRLKPEFTRGDVAVTGNVTLDDLRAAFPGY